MLVWSEKLTSKMMKIMIFWVFRKLIKSGPPSSRTLYKHVLRHFRVTLAVLCWFFKKSKKKHFGPRAWHFQRWDTEISENTQPQHFSLKKIQPPKQEASGYGKELWFHRVWAPDLNYSPRFRAVAALWCVVVVWLLRDGLVLVSGFLRTLGNDERVKKRIMVQSTLP